MNLGHNLDHTETGGVDSVLQADEEGGLSNGSDIVNLACRSATALHLSSFQHSSQIMDLDYSEAGDVIFASHREADENYADFAVKPIRHSAPAPRLISLQDDDKTTDLADTVTRDVVFASRPDVWGNHSTGAKAADLVHRSTPAPHVTHNQVMDLDITEAEDAAFVSQPDAEGGFSTDFETVSPAHRATPTPLSSPQHDGHIMNLDDAETGSQRVTEDESDTDSETVSLSVIQPLPLISFLSRMITRSRIWMVLRPWMLFSRQEWMSGMAIPLAPGRWTLSVAQHLPRTSPFLRITSSWISAMHKLGMSFSCCGRTQKEHSVLTPKL